MLYHKAGVAKHDRPLKKKTIFCLNRFDRQTITNITSTRELMKYIRIDPAVVTVKAYTKLDKPDPKRKSGTRVVEFSVGKILEDDDAQASARKTTSDPVVRRLLELTEPLVEGTLSDNVTGERRKQCGEVTIYDLFKSMKAPAMDELDSMFAKYGIERPAVDGKKADRAFIDFALRHIQIKDDEGVTVQPGACECSSSQF